MTSALASLEARIAAATGPDREIDAALWLMCFEPTCAHFNVTFHTEQYDNYVSREYIECDLGTMALDQMEPPLLRYTGFLDDAVALLRKRRVRVRVEALPNGEGVASVYDADDKDGPACRAPTPALALSLAFVRAMRAKEEAK